MEIISSLTSIAYAHTEGGFSSGHMSFNTPMMGVGAGFLWMMFLILLFWVLVIVGIVFLVRHLSRYQRKTKEKAPMEILKERYAKGEIDKEEFENKKKELEE